MALRNRKASRGFTLIELLVVVAIIGLLAAFAVPKLFEAINKSKGAQGAADLKTISAALERYYFDNNKYPTPATATAFRTELAPYLKNSTTYANGFGKGLFYATDTNGTAGYVLVDPKNATGTNIVVCTNGAGTDVTFDVDADLQVSTDVSDFSTCTTPASMAMETN